MPAISTSPEKALNALLAQAKRSLGPISSSIDRYTTQVLLKEARTFLESASAKEYLQSWEKLSARLLRHKRGEDVEALIEASVHTEVECCQDKDGCYGYLIGLVIRGNPSQESSLPSFPIKSSWNQFFQEHALLAPGTQAIVLEQVLPLDQARALTPPDLLCIRGHLQAGRLKRAQNLLNKQAPAALTPACTEFSLMMAYVRAPVEDALPAASQRIAAFQHSLFSYFDADTLESALDSLHDGLDGAGGAEEPLQLLVPSEGPKAKQVEDYLASRGLGATGFVDKWFEALYQAESRVDLVPF